MVRILIWFLAGVSFGAILSPSSLAGCERLYQADPLREDKRKARSTSRREDPDFLLLQTTLGQIEALAREADRRNEVAAWVGQYAENLDTLGLHFRFSRDALAQAITRTLKLEPLLRDLEKPLNPLYLAYLDILYALHAREGTLRTEFLKDTQRLGLQAALSTELFAIKIQALNTHGNIPPLTDPLKEAREKTNSEKPIEGEQITNRLLDYFSAIKNLDSPLSLWEARVALKGIQSQPGANRNGKTLVSTVISMVLKSAIENLRTLGVSDSNIALFLKTALRNDKGISESELVSLLHVQTEAQEAKAGAGR